MNLQCITNSVGHQYNIDIVPVGIFGKDKIKVYQCYNAQTGFVCGYIGLTPAGVYGPMCHDMETAWLRAAKLHFSVQKNTRYIKQKSK